MQYMEAPGQSELFDVFEGILSRVAYQKLRSGWQHLFRCVILSLLPAGRLAKHFDPILGRPTKELYSMAGLLFVMEFRDWTYEEAADAYMFNADLQYALNLRPAGQSMCRRTIDRYVKLFREDELRQSVAEDLCFLVDRYRRNKQHYDRSTYQMLVTVFEQQCEVVDEKVVVKKKTGGDIVVNPSDPDATLDGHKGSTTACNNLVASVANR